MQKLIDSVKDAIADKSTLHIKGNNSKEFLHDANSSSEVSVADYSGIIDYQPAELFIRVKVGTKLSEINDALLEQHQFLGFMPPDYGNSTIGGTVACGLSGSSRYYLGGLRDHILGLKLINGRGKLLNFGGQMIKNVAGFDVTRMLCGSRGRLGIITEVSLKVLPLALEDITLKIPGDYDKYINKTQKVNNYNLPIISSAALNGYVYFRLQGFKSAVKNARQLIKGEVAENSIWQKLNPFKLELKPGENLWRTTVAPDNKISPDTVAIDWGGIRRWLVTTEDSDPEPNGKSILWHGKDKAIYAKKSDAIISLEDKIKVAFDPHGVFV